jgi:hypothetical protein
MYALRLFNEIWNGLCPPVALFVDVVYEICRQLVVILYAHEIILYCLLWLLRLFLFLLEPLIEAFVLVLEAFAQFAEDMTVGLTAALQREADEQFGRRAAPPQSGPVPAEILLYVCVVLFTALINACAAVLVAFLPLLYSFLRVVLPKLLKYGPVVADVVIKLFSLFASEPVRRIAHALIEMLPIILELLQGFICGIVVVLGPILCYLVYFTAVTLYFILTYMVQPCVCSVVGFLAGCTRSMLYAALAGRSCYTCGSYSTACGCSHGYAPSNAGDCGSTCVSASDPVGVPPPAPAAAPLGNRTYSGVDTTGNRFATYVTGDDALNDLMLPRNTGPDDDADISFSDDVYAAVTTHGTPIEQCNRAQDPTCTGGDTEEHLYRPGELALPRRRRTDPTSSPTSAPTPVGGATSAPTPPTAAPTASPTVAPTTASAAQVTITTVAASTVHTVVSGTAVYTSSPGFYSGALVQFESANSVYRMGTLPYRSSSSDALACTDASCVLATAAAALGSDPSRSAHVSAAASLPWVFAEFVATAWLRVDLATPCVVSWVGVTWAAVDSSLLAGPAAYDLDFVDVADVASTVAVTGATCTLDVAQQRADAVDNDRPTQRISYVRLRALTNSSCAAASSGHIGHLQLAQLSVWGRSNTTTGDSVHLRTAAGLQAQTSYRAPDNDTHVWDPCASGTPQRVADGLGSPPALAWAASGNGTGALTLHLHDAEGDSASAAVTAAVVHLATNLPINRSGVLLCAGHAHATWQEAVANTSTSCFTADEASADYAYTGRVWPGAAALSTTYSSNLSAAQISAGLLPAAFWETGYAYEHPIRGESLRFAPGNLSAASWTLWLGPAAFSSARSTTWDVARLEAGLHPDYQALAQWTATVAAGLTGDGKTTAATSMSTLYCARELEDAVLGLTSPSTAAHVLSPYADPFGGSAESRQWVGVHEIDLFGTALPTEEGARRSTHQEYGAGRHEDLDSLRSVRARVARWATEADAGAPQRHTVTSVLAVHGHHTGRELDRDAELLHPEAGRVGRTRPDHAAHPFHASLAQLPHLGTEPQFVCTDALATGDTHCHVIRRQALPDTHRDRSAVNSSDAAHPTSSGLTAAVDRLRATGLALRARDALRRVPIPMGPMGAVRRLQGSGLDIWDSIKDSVQSLVDETLRAFETGVAAALACPAYCHASAGCTWSRLGDCLPAMGENIVRTAFQCSDDQSLFDCTIGRVLQALMEALLRLVDYILRLMDLAGGLIGRILGLGDLLKSIACHACSITGVIAGALADFVDNFSKSHCDVIIEKGTEQCGRWDMGDIEEVGAAIFGNFLPLLKVLFGIAQVLPALSEVTVETAVLIFGGLFDVFPTLIDDAADILSWFISAAGVVGTMEVLFVALGDVVSDAVAQGDKVTRTSGTTSFADIAEEAVTSPNTAAAGEGAFYGDEAIGATECFHAQADAGAVCDVGTTAATDTAAVDAIYTEVEAGRSGYQTTAQAGYGATLEFSTGGCGCRVARQACSDGMGAGNCPYKDSVAVGKRAALAAAAVTQAAAGDPVDPEAWPHCAELNERVVLPGSTALHRTSPELTRVNITSKRCYVLLKSTTATGGSYNDMALTSALHLANASAVGEPAWWPFEKTSKQDGDVTLETDADFFTAAMPDEYLNHPTLGHVFRRRGLTPTPGPTFPVGRRLLARHTLGIQGIFSDTTPDEALAATRAMAGLRARHNGTFAEQQFELLRADLRDLSAHIAQGIGEIRVPEFLPGRKLMAGFSGADADDVACAFTDTPGAFPNTYPCAKGLWCAWKPPIPRGDRFELEWISWRSSWVDNSRCKEMDTYLDAYLFAARAICTSVRQFADDHSAAMWPWSSVIKGIWSFAEFPDGRWPAAARHRPPWDSRFTAMCVGLNIGAYLVPFFVVLVLVFVWRELVEVGRAVTVAVDQVRYPEVTPEDIERLRQGADREIESSNEKQTRG